MSGEQRIAAPVETVWSALNDLAILHRSIPGCDRIERVDRHELYAEVTSRIGTVEAQFKGRIKVHDVDPQKSYRLTGEGNGGSAGFANGSATVTLAAKDEGTVLTYQVDAAVGGKLAQLGPRVVDPVAQKMATAFFARFGSLVGKSSEPDVSEAEPPALTFGLKPFVWVPLLIVVIGLLMLLFA